MTRLPCWLAGLCSAVAIGGCSLAPSARPPVDTWDFGPREALSGPREAASGPQEAVSPKIAGTLLVQAIAAPSWLDSPAVFYRLAYSNAAETHAYATTRWAASPAVLLTERLRSSLAAAGATVLAPGDGARAPRNLKVELEEFSQSFDSPSASRAVLLVRATLSAAAGSAAQRSFVIDVPSPSGDARGAALSLGQAANRGVAEIVAWIAANPLPR